MPLLKPYVSVTVAMEAACYSRYTVPQLASIAGLRNKETYGKEEPDLRYVED